jgi:altronate hydrolase
MTPARPPRPALVLSPRDNVATALVPLAAGQCVRLDEATVTLSDDVPRGHKFALRPIASGEPVLKYGQPIGLATAPIAPGQHVHVHNVASARAGGPARRASPPGGMPNPQSRALDDKP